MDKFLMKPFVGRHFTPRSCQVYLRITRVEQAARLGRGLVLSIAILIIITGIVLKVTVRKSARICCLTQTDWIGANDSLSRQGSG
jgi:hypothetical protein